MNSVYDIGNQLNVKWLDDNAVAVGDNKLNIIEVGTTKLFAPAAPTSDDIPYCAGSMMLILRIEKGVLAADGQEVQVQVLESDDTIEANFLPVDDSQFNITNTVTKQTGITDYKGSTASPLANDLYLAIKYNGFKNFIRLNVKGVGAVGTGRMGAAMLLMHLDNQHGPIQWEPTNP